MERFVCSRLLKEDYTTTTSTSSTSTSNTNNNIIGSIVPWLQLEVVHNITTLLWQGMIQIKNDPTNYDDDPQVLQQQHQKGNDGYVWILNQDTYNRIDREFNRLYNLGFDFLSKP